MVNQRMKIMAQHLRVLKIDLVVFDQLVHIHRHVQHHRNQMKQINHYGIVRILINQITKVHFKLVQGIILN